jgi:hypothetical protein
VDVAPADRLRLVAVWPSRLPEEQNDEWAVGRRYFSTDSMNKLHEPSPKEGGRGSARAAERIADYGRYLTVWHLRFRGLHTLARDIEVDDPPTAAECLFLPRVFANRWVQVLGAGLPR